VAKTRTFNNGRVGEAWDYVSLWETMERLYGAKQTREMWRQMVRRRLLEILTGQLDNDG
jgi:hypothetical protein